MCFPANFAKFLRKSFSQKTTCFSVFLYEYHMISAYGTEFLGAYKRRTIKLVNSQTQGLSVNTRNSFLSALNFESAGRNISRRYLS